MPQKVRKTPGKALPMKAVTNKAATISKAAVSSAAKKLDKKVAKEKVVKASLAKPIRTGAKKVSITKTATKKGAASASSNEIVTKAKAALKKESVELSAKNEIQAADSSELKATAKAKTKTRKLSIAVDPAEAPSALASKWASLFKKAEKIESKPYNMKNSFEEKTGLTHKLLGWGYILSNRNDRLEVLFKDGIKYLISNYKP